MPITLEQAKSLKCGQVLYHATHRDRDGFPVKWRVSGQPRTWKTDPGRVEVPIKHGLYDHDTITARCLNLLCLEEDEAMGGQMRFRDVPIGSIFTFASDVLGVDVEWYKVSTRKYRGFTPGRYEGMECQVGSINVWVKNVRR